MKAAQPEGFCNTEGIRCDRPVTWETTVQPGITVKNRPPGEFIIIYIFFQLYPHKKTTPQIPKYTRMHTFNQSKPY